MKGLAALLNENQVGYILICYAGLAGTVGLGARAFRAGWKDAVAGTDTFRPHWRCGVPFLLGLGIAVVLFRLPGVLTERVLNLDECAQVVGGWSLLADPVPWRGSDLLTSGPMNTYLLAVAFWVGLPVKLITARLVMVMLAFALIGCTYGTLLKLGGQLAAVPAALALGFFVCLAADANHIHYNSEALSVALLAGALLLHVLGRERGPVEVFRGKCRARVACVYGAGLLLGATAYAKLQAMPLACYLAMVFVVDLWRTRQRRAKWWTEPVAFVLGGISVPSLLSMVLLVTGTWHEFTTSYLGFGHSYGFEAASRLFAAAWVFCGPDMPWFLLCCSLVVVGLFCCLDRAPRLPRRGWLLLAALVGYLAAGVFAVQAPKTGFTHYSALVLHPVALLFGASVCYLTKLLAASFKAGRRLAARAALRCAAAATLVLLVVHVCRWRIEMPREEGYFPTLLGSPGYSWVPLLPIAPRQTFPVADFIARHAQPGDRLSVWGWAPNYYVFSGVRNATRDAVTLVAMPPTLVTAGWGDALRAHYRQRYLADLRHNRPAFFVDAVSGAEFECTDRQALGHETYPELARFVAENYVEVFELLVAPGDATRVYLLRERSTTLKASAPPPVPVPGAGGGKTGELSH